MSHLRAPGPRADRREGGRHGRPAAHNVPPLPETHIRPQLMRLAVLPPVAVALAAGAAVLFMARSTGVRPGLTLSAVLAGAVSVTLAAVAIAAVAADRAARSVRDRVDALRAGSVRGEADLRTVLDALRRGEAPSRRKARGGGPPGDADDFELLAADLAREREGAVTAVVQAARLSGGAGHEQKVEVFVNLARRLQSLVHREISLLDELENQIEDPDLLKGLFHVDHLATRIRRHAENLAVLGGAVSRRQWSNPVPMTEVLRSAIAEVEQYSRVRLVPPVEGTLRGHAVADVMHLLAELVENATVFSAPHTQVLLRATAVTAGLAVEVEDRGLGMPADEQNSMNQLLARPDQVNVASLLADGRIGLYVVSQLARRHGINVRLQSNIYGGVQAVLVLPPAVLGAAIGTADGAEGTDGTVVAGGVAAIAGPARQGALPALQPASTAPRLPPTGSGAGEVLVPAARGAGAPVATPVPAAASRPARRPSDAPSPLPRRNAQEGRPTPAEAAPGIRPDDRAAVAEHVGEVPVPRAEALRGTMHKPHLPKRRALEHLAPQLLDAPVPRQDDDEFALHDPGLVAAFRRGVGLAETRQAMDPAEAGEAGEARESGRQTSGRETEGGEPPSEAIRRPASTAAALSAYRPGTPGTPGGSALAALRAGAVPNYPRDQLGSQGVLSASASASASAPSLRPVESSPVHAPASAEAHDGRDLPTAGRDTCWPDGHPDRTDGDGHAARQEREPEPRETELDVDRSPASRRRNGSPPAG